MKSTWCIAWFLPSISAVFYLYFLLVAPASAEITLFRHLSFNLPNLSFDKVGFHIEISNISCSNLLVGNLATSFAENITGTADAGLFGLSFENALIGCSSTWKFRRTRFPHIPFGQGRVEIDIKGLSSTYDIEIIEKAIQRENDPHFSLKVCKMRMDSLALDFSDSLMSSIFDSFGIVLSEYIKLEIQPLFCKQWEKILESLAAENRRILATIARIDSKPSPMPSIPKSIDPYTWDDNKYVLYIDYMINHYIGAEKLVHYVNQLTNYTGEVNIPLSFFTTYLEELTVDLSMLLPYLKILFPSESFKQDSISAYSFLQHRNSSILDIFKPIDNAFPSVREIKFIAKDSFVKISGLNSISNVTVLKPNEIFDNADGVKDDILKFQIIVSKLAVDLNLALDVYFFNETEGFPMRQFFDISSNLKNFNFTSDLLFVVDKKRSRNLSTLQFFQPHCIFPSIKDFQLLLLNVDADIRHSTFHIKAIARKLELEIIQVFNNVLRVANAFFPTTIRKIMHLVTNYLLKSNLNKDFSETIRKGHIEKKINFLIQTFLKIVSDNLGQPQILYINKLIKSILVLLQFNSSHCVAAVNDPLIGAGPNHSPVSKQFVVFCFGIFGFVSFILMAIAVLKFNPRKTIEISSIDDTSALLGAKNADSQIVSKDTRNRSSSHQSFHSCNTEEALNLSRSTKPKSWSRLRFSRSLSSYHRTYLFDGLLQFLIPLTLSISLFFRIWALTHVLASIQVTADLDIRHFSKHAIYPTNLPSNVQMNGAFGLNTALSPSVEYKTDVVDDQDVNTQSNENGGNYFLKGDGYNKANHSHDDANIDGDKIIDTTTQIVNVNIINFAFQDLVLSFWECGARFTAVVIFGGCLVMPLVKHIALILIWWAPLPISFRGHLLLLAGQIGKFAFADVLFLTFIMDSFATTDHFGPQSKATLSAEPVINIFAGMLSTSLLGILGQILIHLHFKHRSGKGGKKKDDSIPNDFSEGKCSSDSKKIKREGTGYGSTGINNIGVTYAIHDHNNEGGFIDVSSRTNSYGSDDHSDNKKDGDSNPEIVDSMINSQIDDSLNEFEDLDHYVHPESYHYSLICYTLITSLLVVFIVSYVQAVRCNLVEIKIGGIAGEWMGPTQSSRILSLLGIPYSLPENSTPNTFIYAQLLRVFMFLVLVISPLVMVICAILLLTIPLWLKHFYFSGSMYQTSSSGPSFGPSISQGSIAASVLTSARDPDEIGGPGTYDDTAIQSHSGLNFVASSSTFLPLFPTLATVCPASESFSTLQHGNVSLATCYYISNLYRYCYAWSLHEVMFCCCIIAIVDLNSILNWLVSYYYLEECQVMEALYNNPRCISLTAKLLPGCWWLMVACFASLSLFHVIYFFEMNGRRKGHHNIYHQ